MPEIRSLPCALSAPEIAERADLLAKLVAKEQAIEVAKKAAADEYKEQLEHAGGEIRRLAKQVRDRSEDRDVEIDYSQEWIFLWPLERLGGAIESVMAQNRIGIVSHDRREPRLHFVQSSTSLLTIGADGYINCRPDLASAIGNKKGSR